MAKYFVLLALAALLAVVGARREDRQEIVNGAFGVANAHNSVRTPANGAPVAAEHGHHRAGRGHHRGGHGHHRGGRGHGHHGRGGPRSQTGVSGLHRMQQLHRTVLPAFNFHPAARNQGEVSHHKRMMETIRAHLGEMRNNGFQGHRSRGQGQGHDNALSQNLRFATQVGRRGGHHGNGQQGNRGGSDDMRPERRLAHHMGHGNRRNGHRRGNGMGPRYTVA
ncbi:filaggrin-2-like isoform X2 [Littorina saxatilis]|uniref:filaggrin-2-like isoform X2 n=1 Tax=Littorina saxatilis TaxID=31220 RepID=UPI0038B4A19B